MACADVDELSVIFAVLYEIIELEELKKDTPVTKSIVQSAKKLLELDENGIVILKRLTAEINKAFEKIFNSVKRCRILANKKEKLYVEFHKFSVLDGFEMCSKCDKSVGLKAPEILWQLLMEKLFLRKLVSVLHGNDSNESSGASPSGERKLTFIEENAIRYTAAKAKSRVN